MDRYTRPWNGAPRRQPNKVTWPRSCACRSYMGRCGLCRATTLLPPDAKQPGAKRVSTASGSLLGHAFSQFACAAAQDEPQGSDKAFVWHTLAAAQGLPSSEAIMGEACYYGHFGVRQCYFAAIYWLRKASLALEVESPDFKSPSFLSRSLMITKSALCMKVDMVGFSALPEALFWYDIYSSVMAREGHTTDRPDCFSFTKCGCCGARGDIKAATIKRCAKCKAVAYCSKKCQVKHWKMGRKIDCATVEKVITAMKDQRMLMPLESR